MNVLNSDVKITRVSNAAAAGATDVNCTSVDMEGFDGVLFVALLGTLTATQVTALHAQQSTDNSSFADLEGSEAGPLADGDSNKCLVVDVCRPAERYVRAVVDRATANAVIDGVIAIQYRARSRATAHATSVAFSTSVVEPDEGTP